jgi:hypothetical protein
MDAARWSAITHRNTEIMMRQRPPRDLPGQISFTGELLFGQFWKRRMASALGISRTTLRLWLLGLSKSNRDVPSELLFLVDRERVSAGARSAELTALRHDLLSVTGKASDVGA